MEEGGGAIGPSPPPPKSRSSSPRILVVAGEASGDDHAARLVAAIREFCPVAEFLGVGGEEMRAQGVRILTPASELAVVGLMEVVGHLPAIWEALRGIGRVLKTARPDLVILVDFPDFNFLGGPPGQILPGAGVVLHQPPGLGLAHLPGAHPGAAPPTAWWSSSPLRPIFTGDKV